MSVLLGLLAATATALPSPSPQPALATLRDSIAACVTSGFDSKVLTEAGWAFGTHWNLAAPGQRAQDFDKAATGGSLTLNSSFLYYVSCSTSSDFATPEDLTPAQNALIEEFKLQRASHDTYKLSRNTKAFLKEYGLDIEQNSFTDGKYIIIFVQRRVDGRNILAVYVVDPLEGKP